MKRYRVAHYDDIEPVDCPCGWSRRAFLPPGNETASMHVVRIKRDSRTHYHKRLTELYYVLEGKGNLEVDGDRVPLAPGTAALIRPGCRHRALPRRAEVSAERGGEAGGLKVLVVAIPPFDPDDEYED